MGDSTLLNALFFLFLLLFFFPSRGGGKILLPLETMKPTLLQRFFASPWLNGIWFGAWPLLIASATVSAAGFELEFLGNLRLALGYLVVAAIGLALGYFLALFPGCLLVAPLLYFRGRVNGAPFRVGDTVVIIGGPFAGVRTEVYSTWQGDSVRVHLGEEAAKSFEDVFSPLNLRRI